MITQRRKTLLFTLFLLLLTAVSITAVPPIFADDGSYIVQAGDNLFRIALNHGVNIDELVRLNGIADPTQIYAGQVLQMPAKLGEDPAVPVSPTVAVSTYVVQPGDTLFLIAYRHGLLTATVAAANGIADLNHVSVGQVLRIPTNGETAVSEPPQSPAPIPPAPVAAPTGARWIDVNLTNQTLTAYEGSVPVYHTAVSSGYWPYLTVTGEFSVYSRYESQTMNGYALGFDYYLPDVPYVMYFYGNYALHGTYWHNNFGTQMSHGCINLSTADAQWIYNWSAYGTTVNVHY